MESQEGTNYHVYIRTTSLWNIRLRVNKNSRVMVRCRLNEMNNFLTLITSCN